LVAGPRLIDAARAQRVTWERLAGVRRVGGRRAARRRAARVAAAALRRRIAGLPPDNRPAPSVDGCDQLLRRS
jgi:hypothetical protein